MEFHEEMRWDGVSTGNKRHSQHRTVFSSCHDSTAINIRESSPPQKIWTMGLLFRKIRKSTEMEEVNRRDGSNSQVVGASGRRFKADDQKKGSRIWAAG